MHFPFGMYESTIHSQMFRMNRNVSISGKESSMKLRAMQHDRTPKQRVAISRFMFWIRNSLRKIVNIRFMQMALWNGERRGVPTSWYSNTTSVNPYEKRFRFHFPQKTFEIQIASFLLPFTSNFSNEWRNEILHTHATHRTLSTNTTNPWAGTVPSANKNSN